MFQVTKIMIKMKIILSKNIPLIQFSGSLMQSVLHRNLSQASHPVAITVMIHHACNVHCADDDTDTDSTDYAADNNATYRG